MAISIRWIDDYKAISVLDELNIQHTLATISISKIDWGVTSDNRGRLDKGLEDSDKVDDFVIGMTAGDAFPKPIAVLAKSGHYQIPAGVHRVKAASKLGVKSIEVHLADIEQEDMIRFVGIQTNRKEGTRLSKDEAMEYAIHFCETGGYAAAETAKRLGISKSALQVALKSRRLAKEASEAGSRRAHSAPVHILNALGTLKANPTVLAKAIDHATKHGFSTDASRQLARNIVKQKTEAQQLAFIEKDDERRQIEVRANGPIRSRVRSNFLTAFRSLAASIEGKKTLDDLKISKGGEEHAAIDREWRALRRAINAILN